MPDELYEECMKQIRESEREVIILTERSNYLEDQAKRSLRSRRYLFTGSIVFAVMTIASVFFYLQDQDSEYVLSIILCGGFSVIWYLLSMSYGRSARSFKDSAEKIRASREIHLDVISKLKSLWLS